MTNEEKNNGLSLLSKLDQYWIKRAVKPASIPNERLLFISPEHWIKYVFPSLLYALFVAASAALFYFAAFMASNVFSFLLFFLPALLVLTSVHHWFFWFLLAESQTCIIVTNKRVVYIHQGLLWNETMIEVSFEKMKTVEAHKRTVLQSILNYGTLQFESMQKIKRVPHPGTLTRQIQQAMGMI